ncbi:PREDICTED: zinc finger protein 431-like, partial [Crocodylus porosus]|uniref:zinc finger protein 431-like n=1 Tax=Crocodylus porosus TaxID=8502 RepID=UPI00093DF93B
MWSAAIKVSHPKQGESLELREVFEDVAVYFTRKEWELLEDEDTVLYQHQMLRNFQALVSLGKSLVLASPWSCVNSEIYCLLPGFKFLSVFQHSYPHAHLAGGLNPLLPHFSVSDQTSFTYHIDRFSFISGVSLPHTGGTWLMSGAEEETPMEGPANLEPPWTSPGSLGEMDSLKPESKQWPKNKGRPPKQMENVAVNQCQHFHLKRKTHHCTECRKSFICWQDLFQHQCVQMGGQPHQCTKCGKSFKQLSSLARHRSMHTRKKPHQCSECGKSFYLSSNLTKHQLIHTGRKP